MDILEVATRDKSLTAGQFRSFAELFFKQNQLEMFTTKEEAEGILGDADSIANVLHVLDDVENVKNSMLMIGSIFGEALILTLNGNWKYSDRQERWVIECVNVKGEVMEFNIFNKLEKYFENGDVDSLNYYFAQSFKLFSGNSDVG